MSALPRIFRPYFGPCSRTLSLVSAKKSGAPPWTIPDFSLPPGISSAPHLEGLFFIPKVRGFYMKIFFHLYKNDFEYLSTLSAAQINKEIDIVKKEQGLWYILQGNELIKAAMKSTGPSIIEALKCKVRDLNQYVKTKIPKVLDKERTELLGLLFTAHLVNTIMNLEKKLEAGI